MSAMSERLRSRAERRLKSRTRSARERSWRGLLWYTERAPGTGSLLALAVTTAACSRCAELIAALVSRTGASCGRRHPPATAGPQATRSCASTSGTHGLGLLRPRQAGESARLSATTPASALLAQMAEAMRPRASQLRRCTCELTPATISCCGHS